MQPAKLWQSEHWHRKEFWRGKSLGLLCPWPTTAAPMSESLLSRCQSFKATKPFDCALVWTLCTIHTWGRVSHWSLVVPCPAYLFESALLIHIHLWAGLQLGLPPVHHQYYYTIVLSARNVFRRTFNRFAMQCWFSTTLLGWVVGVRREQRGLPQ